MPTSKGHRNRRCHAEKEFPEKPLGAKQPSSRMRLAIFPRSSVAFGRLFSE
jgi:hypothetical protein